MAERNPRRSPVNVPARSPHRGELTAGLATALLLAQLLFAQFALVACLLLVAAAVITRWRPQWLVVPASAGLCWLLGTGPGRPLAGFAAGSLRAVRYLAAAAAHPARLLDPAAALAGAVRWLPAQLPVALLAGSCEAAAVLWLAWHRQAPDWRPGLIAVLRRRAATATLAAGQTATRDGCALGLRFASGRLAGFSWAQAASGVLVTGRDPAALVMPGLAAVCAALRRRKTVLILDLTPAAAGGATASGAPVRGAPVRGAPVRGAPVRGAPVRGAPVRGATARGSFAADVADLAGRLGIAVARPGTGQAAAAIGRAVRSRGVVLLQAPDRLAAAQFVADLGGVLASLRDLDLRADCLTVITGCEAVPPGPLTAVLGLGPLAGNALLLLTASPAVAAALSPAVGLGVVSGPVSPDLAGHLSGHLATRPPGDAAARQPGRSAARQPGRSAAHPSGRSAARPSGQLTADLSEQLTTQPPGLLTVLTADRKVAGAVAGSSWPVTSPVTWPATAAAVAGQVAVVPVEPERVR